MSAPRYSLKFRAAYPNHTSPISITPQILSIYPQSYLDLEADRFDNPKKYQFWHVRRYSEVEIIFFFKIHALIKGLSSLDLPNTLMAMPEHVIVRQHAEGQNQRGFTKIRSSCKVFIIVREICRGWAGNMSSIEKFFFWT